MHKQWLHIIRLVLNFKIIKTRPYVVDIHVQDKSTSDQEEESEEVEIWDMSELIQEESLVVIRSAEEMTPYYLLSVVEVCLGLPEEQSDNFRNRYQQGSRVVKGHYYELLPKSQDTYSIDSKHLAIVPIKCVAAICTPLEASMKKVKGHNKDCFKVPLWVHEELIALTMWLPSVTKWNVYYVLQSITATTVPVQYCVNKGI